MLESLESRLLCANGRYNLLTLIGYNDPGSVYKYRTTATVSKNDLVDASTSVTTSKTSIAKVGDLTPPVYNAKTTTTDNNGGRSLELAERTDGVNLYADNYDAKGVAVDFNFSNVQIAPSSLAFNKKYTGAGDVSGKVNVDTSSGSFNGTFTGSVDTSVTLYGVKSVTVRGHTYANAIEGAFAFNLSGTLKFSKFGISRSGPVDLVQTNTFYAVPGVGIVTQRQSITITGSISNSGTQKVPISSRDDLISYVLGDNA